MSSNEIVTPSVGEIVDSQTLNRAPDPHFGTASLVIVLFFEDQYKDLDSLDGEGMVLTLQFVTLVVTRKVRPHMSIISYFHSSCVDSSVLVVFWFNFAIEVFNL